MFTLAEKDSFTKKKWIMKINHCIKIIAYVSPYGLEYGTYMAQIQHAHVYSNFFTIAVSFFEYIAKYLHNVILCVKGFNIAQQRKPRVASAASVQ